MSQGLQEVERELARVVDRLTAMPLTRAAAAADDCQRAAEVILEQTRLIDPDLPEDARLPRLQPQGLGAMLAVIGHDWLDAARASSEPDIDPVLDALVSLRRALP